MGFLCSSSFRWYTDSYGLYQLTLVEYILIVKENSLFSFFYKSLQYNFLLIIQEFLLNNMNF